MLLSLAPVLSLAGPISRAHCSSQTVGLKSLDHAQAELLLSVARTLFPHDFVPDDQYMKIVAALDAKAAADTSRNDDEGSARRLFHLLFSR